MGTRLNSIFLRELADQFKLGASLANLASLIRVETFKFSEQFYIRRQLRVREALSMRT